MSDGFDFSWLGTDVQKRAERALARGILVTATVAARQAKETVHVITGTLQRSIHIAAVDHAGLDDESTAHAGIDLMDSTAITSDDKQLELMMGSWISYAMNEELLHPYLQPAIQMVTPIAKGFFVAAFADEGLVIT